MPLTELLPVVDQLSHQDKLRLIHYQTSLLLQQLGTTEAVVWSPHDSYDAVQTLSELLVAAQQDSTA